MKRMISKAIFMACTVVAVTFTSSLQAQIELDINLTPEELASIINGNGVQILNPVITCADSAFGAFDISGIGDFPNGTGVALSTGNIFDMYGPNVLESTTTEWFTPGDPDINIITNATSFDACAFEFDVVPVGDTLRFDFTFASEEYEEYVGTPFNDAFAFLISGPGITGDPGLSGFENIALIPNTTTPVTINNVNNGNPDIGFPAANPDFFHSNPPGFGTDFEYDGWTKGLFAQKVVTACDTFRLKLVIADVADRRWDSTVFIEAIESNSITLTAETDAGIDNMIEGCNDGTITFTRVPVTGDPLDVIFFIGGTATNGVDYPLIGTDPDPDVPKIITIPANEASASILIEPFDDGIDEGIETIIFYVGNPNCPGTIQDSLIFNIQDELLVEIDPPLVFLCPGESHTFTVNEGGVTFAWTPGDFLDDPNIMEPTATPDDDIIYTLTTTASECVATAEGEIRVSNIVLSADASDILCGGSGEGEINLTVAGGETPYEFEWSGPDGFSSTDQNLTGLEPGTYTVVVTDREGCTAETTATVSENDPITITLSSPTFAGGNNISCAGAADGQATATVEGGTPGYSFQWNDPANQTGQTATGLAAGTYILTVTDSEGCESSASIELSAPAPITGVLDERVDVLCFGESTGSITITAVGGTGPYNYLWNTTPPQTGPQATGIPAGIYTVNITDVNGCVGSAEAEILEPAAPLGGNVAVTPLSCSGIADGTATVTPTGGTPPYSYSWSANPAVTGPTITELMAGAYNVTITDDNGCTLTLPFNVSEPAEIQINILSQINVDCLGGSTGSVTVNAVGGTAPFSYSWNTSPTTTGPTITGVPAGTYTVTVIDANGCGTSQAITITGPEEALEIVTVAEIDPTCSNTNNGSIEVDASGGTAPFSFVWNTTPPTSGSLLDNLGPGSYTVTATDANGCTTSQTFELTAPDPIQLTVLNVQNVLCTGDETGSIAVEVDGGTPPYDLLWDDPLAQTTAVATNLAAGTYTLTVEDANGCIATIQATVTEPQFPLGGTIVSTTDVPCFGESTGSATVTGTGGSGSYSYQWNDPAGQQTSTASNLAPGTYNVTITDNNGCDTPVVLEVIIDGPDEELELTLTPSVFDGGFNVACADDSTATIDLGITGGTAPYEVLWNLPGSETSTDQNLADLAPGTYSVTVTDANGCTATGTITLTAPTPIVVTATTTPSLCFGVPQGSISIAIDGGVPGYTATWAGPEGFTGSGLELNDIVGGIYFLTVEDSNGCIYLDAVTVVQPEDLTITVDSISDINGFNTSCWNSQDGAIFITPGGGVTPYSYTWNTPGNPAFSNQQNVTNVGPGTYEVVLIDENGCVESETIEVIGPDPISVDFELSAYPNGFNISCNGEADGSITALPSGGSPGYTFTWIGAGGFGPVFENPIEDLIAGEYSVLIQDANGCTFADAVTLTQPPALSIQLIAEEINGSNISCEGETDGTINLIISGNSAPYTIAWTGPDGFTSSSEDLFNLGAGTYCVTVTDVNDCSQEACITLDAPEELAVSLSSEDLTCGGAGDGSITSAVTGGTAPFSYSWTGPGNFTSTQANLSSLNEGTYCVTVTDANGCTANACLELIAAPEIEIDLVANPDPSCEGDGSGAIAATITGGVEPFTFDWTGPDGFTANTQNLDDVSEGLYCLTVTDAQGCTAQACIELIAPPAVNVVLTPNVFQGGFGVSCSDAADGSILSTVSGGSPAYTYAWTGPNGFTASTANIDNLEAGTYCLEVTDANGCFTDVCTALEAPEPIAVDSDIVFPDCGVEGSATVTLTTDGGTPPYTYNWSSGDNTAVVNLEEGAYTVLVADANGCEILVPIAVTFPDDIAVVLQSPIVPGGFNIGCNGDATASITTTVEGGSGDLAYDWTGPNGYTSTDENPTGLTAGTYCVTVTDELGCTAEGCIELTEPDAVSLDLDGTDPLCANLNTGNIAASAAGGTPTYSFEWTGPAGFTATGATISQLAPGEYCAEVTDINGCSAFQCITLTAPSPILVDLTSPEVDGFNIACFGDNTGAISSTVGGGNPGYTYSWSGPDGFFSPAPNIQNLFAGTYCLNVTDQNGCEVETCITLSEAPSLAVSFDVFEYANGFNTTCSNTCDGSLEATITGGTGPFTANWVGPGNFTSSDLVLSDLCPGLYTLTIVDANGCEEDTQILVESPPAITVDLESPTFNGGTEISCFGDANAIINTSVTGGVPGYSYAWTGPNGFTSGAANLVNIGPGTYTLTVTDDTGCEATAAIAITEPEAPLTGTADVFEFPSGDEISCLGASDGSINAEALGGTGPYQFNWLGPDGFESQVANLENLGPGEYTLVIEDANSCVFTIVVALNEPETALQAAVTDTIEVACHNAPGGGLTVEAEGGSPGYSITWIGPGGFASNAFSIDNLLPGTYTYAVEDINGCAVSGAIEIENPAPIMATGEISNALCKSASGAIAVSVSGGTPGYEFFWSNGELTQNLLDVAAGEYTLIVTDANNCEAEFTFVVEEVNNLNFVAEVSNPRCFGDADGSIQLALLTGTQPVTITWEGPDGFTGTGNNLFDLAAGDYTAFATDDNGCTFEQTFNVNQPFEIVIEELVSPEYPNGFNLTGFETGDGVINNPEISGGTTPYTLSWTGPNGFTSQGAGQLAGLAAGTYTLTVTDFQNCSDTISITLTQPVTLELPNGISPNGDGFNDGLIVRGLEDFPNNKVMIFNRWGNLLFEENNYRNDTPWMGTNNSGEQIPEGTYFVIVEIQDRDALRGYLELRR